MNKKYGDWFCTKCIGTVPSEHHEGCNYTAYWIESPLKKEIAELKEDRQTLAKALLNAADEIERARIYNGSLLTKKYRDLANSFIK